MNTLSIVSPTIIHQKLGIYLSYYWVSDRRVASVHIADLITKWVIVLLEF